VVAVAALLIVPNLPVSVNNLKTPEAIVRNQVNGLTAGDPNAPVKVYEYSDFECVHCYDFWKQLEPSFVADYVNTGKVYLTYVPFSFISPESYTAAQAAYCASDQGKFWQYHDYLFVNYGATLNDQMLKTIAQAVGLDMTQFNQCYQSGKYTQQVLDDLNSGRTNGVNSTPTFDVNGTLVDWGNLVNQVNSVLAQP
jgi:protein-disulfide isomerase